MGFPGSSSAPVAVNTAIVREDELDGVKILLSAPLTAPKVPASAPRRSKRVLREEVYVDAMAHIIRRDYFPDLHHVVSKLDGVDAARLGTPGVTPAMATPVVATPAVVATISAPPTPGCAPKPPCSGSFRNNKLMTAPAPVVAAGANPDRTPFVRARRRPAVAGASARDMTLARFCATHTSEDNDSFQDLMVKDSVKRQRRNGWLREGEAMVARRSIRAAGGGDGSSTGSLRFWDYKSKNSLMYTPDGRPPAAHPLPPRHRKKKAGITAANTRFPGTLEEQAARAAVNAATPAQIAAAGLGAGATPNVRGYRFVRTPSPSPAHDGASPIITWGSVTGTPLHLRDEDSVAEGEDKAQVREASFKMPERPARERLAHQLGERARQKRLKRKGKRRGGTKPQVRTPVRSPSGPGFVELSPAALSLLRRKRRRTSGRGRADSQLRASYGTPSPVTRSGMGSNTPLGASGHV